MKRVILEIVQNLAPGGIESWVLTFFGKISDEEEIHIVSLEQTYASACQRWPRLRALPKDRLHFLNKAPGWQLGCFRQLWQLIRQLKVNVVHAHHIGPLVYGGLAAILARVPVFIYTEHDVWHLALRKTRYLQRSVLFLTGCLIKRRIVVTISAPMACELKQLFPELTATVINHGIDITQFVPGSQLAAQQYWGLSPQARWVGCAGRLVVEKGQSLLLRALVDLPLPWHVVFAGDGPLLSTLQAQAQQFGVEKRCVFLGAVDAMPLFYQAIDIFCLPSLAEGVPLVALEAQACNKPVIVTQVGQAATAVCPLTGRVVPPGDPQALAQAILERYATPLAANPRDFVVREHHLQQMLKAYRDLMS